MGKSIHIFTPITTNFLHCISPAFATVINSESHIIKTPEDVICSVRAGIFVFFVLLVNPNICNHAWQCKVLNKCILTKLNYIYLV